MRRNNNQMQGRGGPLMTDHLQDLELELELLKRKRQLIQRQQGSMLYDSPGGSLLNNMRYKDPFNEPRHLNFSHLYDDNPQGNQPFGLKRPAQSDWSGPSRNNMGGQKRSRPNPYVQPFQSNTQQDFHRPGFMPQPLMTTPKPKPLMNFPVQGNRPANRPMKHQQDPKPLNHHPNFRQNKPANRSRPAKRPGGPTAQPVGPANRSTGAANRPTGPANRPAGPVNADPKRVITPKKPSPNTSLDNTPKSKNVLMPNKRPSNKQNGRLELALGTVVKEMKVTYENHPEYKDVFSVAPLTRLLKQSIRERLHSAMIGKVVDKAADIIAEYRAKFPLDTDKEIVELAVLEQKKNENKLKMAIDLLEEGDPRLYFKRNMTRLLQAKFSEMVAKLEKTLTEENKVGITEILEHLPEIKDGLIEANASSETEKTVVNESAIADSANTETALANDEIAQANDETLKANDEAAQANDETSTADAKIAPEKAVEETPTTEVTTKAVGETSANENGSPSDVHLKERIYNEWFSLYIEQRLPRLVYRHKNQIMKIFDLDKMFSNTRAAIIINANNKAKALKAAQINEQRKNEADLTATPQGLLYFAKVLAIPSMPKRKVMQDFLNQFIPKTIKRHKKNYNLLFVGFDSRENYDKILAADQTVLGNATITIMGNIAKSTTNQNDDDLDKVLTPQLDDQINDLLTSIRKADEEAKDNEDFATDVGFTINDSQEVHDLTTTEETNETAAENASNEVKEIVTKPEEYAKPEIIEGNGNGEANNASDDTDIQIIESNGSVVTIEDDEVAPLASDEVKKPAPATPAKGRAPATPRSVNTRRSSRLQN